MTPSDEVANAPSDPAANDVVVRWRGWLLISCLVNIGAVCWLAVLHHPVWRWSLVWWGLVLGLVGLTILESTFFVIQRTVDIPSIRREILRKRQPVYVAVCTTVGVILGVASAIINTAGIDIAGGVLLILSQLLGILLALRVLRRRRSAGF